jgi:hypothetical protein
MIPNADQQRLLARLRDPACPVNAVVVAPTGAGVRQPLVIRMAEVASESLCLIVTTRQDLATQWADRLEAADVRPIVLLTGADAALGILDSSELPHNGVVVTTYESARRKLSADALAAMEFEFTIFDHPDRAQHPATDEPYLRARRTVSLVDRLDAAATAPSTIWHVTLQDLLDRELINATRFAYEEEPAGRELRDAATAVLDEYAEANHISGLLLSDSLPALHRRLLSAASRTTANDDLSGRIWKVLDRMDAYSGPDSRLQALDRLLDEVLDRGARCVVVALTPTDVSYVTDHLTTAGRIPHAVITGMMKPEERKSALASVGPGDCVVATAAVAPVQSWPENTTVILWPSPANDDVLSRLALPGPGVRYVEMKSIEGVETAGSYVTETTSMREYGASRLRSGTDAQAIAVLAPTRKGRRLVDDERKSLVQELVRRYTAGESIRALAEATGRSYGYIHRALMESGVQLRQRGGARRRKKA